MNYVYITCRLSLEAPSLPSFLGEFWCWALEWVERCALGSQRGRSEVLPESLRSALRDKVGDSEAGEYKREGE